MTATASSPASSGPPRPGRLSDVKGWFPELDQVLFDWFLSRQARLGQRGDLLEMGVYMGKSAIFTGAHTRTDERFTVCDLFDAPAPDEHNAAEAQKSYATLTRTAFEANYLAFHDELPRVIQGPTTVVPDRVDADTCRFVHVDASHLYEHVAGDIGTARDVLVEDGIVVVDDFRSEHTPGVAAATWEAVFNGGLRPVCLSTQKLYGTWDDPAPAQEELLAHMRRRGDVRVSVQDIAGRRVLRFAGRPEAPAPPESRFAPANPVPKPAPGSRRLRRIANDVLPPVVSRMVQRRGKV